LMCEFSGGENPEQKGEFDPKGGKYFVEVMTPENVTSNMELFAFYRTLTKHWHFVSMQRKETKQVAKAADVEKDVEIKKVKIDCRNAKIAVIDEMIKDMNAELNQINGGEAAFFGN